MNNLIEKLLYLISYIVKIILRLLFVIALLAYLFSGLIIIVPTIIYILDLNEDPIGLMFEFIENIYQSIDWKQLGESIKPYALCSSHALKVRIKTRMTKRI